MTRAGGKKTPAAKDTIAVNPASARAWRLFRRSASGVTSIEMCSWYECRSKLYLWLAKSGKPGNCVVDRFLCRATPPNVRQKLRQALGKILQRLLLLLLRSGCCGQHFPSRGNERSRGSVSESPSRMINGVQLLVAGVSPAIRRRGHGKVWLGGDGDIEIRRDEVQPATREDSHRF